MVDNISGVILAGGDSTRFRGITKSTMLVDGRSIISRIADTISDIFEELVIVTNTPEIYKQFKDFSIVADIFRNTGPLGGIHAAMKYSKKEALFVFGGDMPLLDREIIIKQIDRFTGDTCDVLIPRISSLIEPLHSIYKRTLCGPLEKYLRDKHQYAVWKFLEEVKISYMDLDDNDEVKRALINVNSSSDILIVEKILRRS